MRSEGKSRSKRKELRFWGWGYADEVLSEEEQGFVELFANSLIPEGSAFVEEPQLEKDERPYKVAGRREAYLHPQKGSHEKEEEALRSPGLHEVDQHADDEKDEADDE